MPNPSKHRWLARASVAICAMVLAVLPVVLAGAASHHSGHQGFEAASTPPPSLLPIEACGSAEAEGRLEPVATGAGAVPPTPGPRVAFAAASTIRPRFLEHQPTSSLRGPPRA